MNKKLLVGGLAGFITLLSGCMPVYTATTPPQKAEYKGVHPLILTQQKPSSSTAYLTINGSYYQLPEECLLTRSYGDLAESRQFGDDAESRNYGDMADNRQFGDDAESRNFGDDAESRQFGDDAESRNYGDMADNRKFGDDAESRSFGDDAESRQFGELATQFRCLKIQNIKRVVVSGFIGQETILVNSGTSFAGYEKDGKTILLKF